MVPATMTLGWMIGKSVKRDSALYGAIGALGGIAFTFALLMWVMSIHVRI